jgi:hypothetical protein
MTNRRFCTPKVTKFGRIGHPGAIERRLVPCVGVTFEDRAFGKKWTFRMYAAYGKDWPPMDVWTVQVLTHVNSKAHDRGVAYGNQVKVEEADVPADVRAFALAELVRLRLRGKVHA